MIKANNLPPFDSKLVLCVGSCYGHIVEEAEPHGCAAFCVVAGGPEQRHAYNEQMDKWIHTHSGRVNTHTHTHMHAHTHTNAHTEQKQ